jgi:hypothetical protein
MRVWLSLLLLVGTRAAVASKPGSNPPYRTDSANEHLAWYQLKPGEFPPLGSEHRVRGELVEADFIHRTGQFRTSATGELVDFALLPYGIIKYQKAEADLRDLPLGTRCEFSLYQDEKGAFTQVVLMDQVLDGAEPQKLATEHQRALHKAFLKARGLPAWIDRVDGKKLTVTLFGDPAGLLAFCKDEGIVPKQWATEHRFIDTIVANSELRTYNPPVDRERSMVVEFQNAPTDCHGSGGIRWVIEPALLLEGFRKGRIVRLFASQAWPVNDMPFGESLYSEAPGVSVGTEEPEHYPYRTDFANEQLPWYQLKPGIFPPLRSHHLVDGELLQVDAVHRSGQFRADRTGELINFTMPPYGSIRYLDSAADLRDLPLKTRYHFYLYQDATGSFTRAIVIMDEFSRLVGDKRTYRLEETRLKDNKLILASQQGMIKNEKDALYRPPDVGRGEFPVNDQTGVWKGDKRVGLSDLAAGDELLVNLTGRTASDRSRCSEIWIGPKTQELFTARQRAKYHDAVKEHGFAAWIEKIEGKDLTIVFFVGPGEEFQTLFNDGPVGRKLRVTPASDDLVAHDTAMETMNFKSSVLSGIHPGTYGCRGTRWIVESEQPLTSYRPGQVVRIFDPAWLTK